MIVMSLNIRGMGSPSNMLGLSRVFEINKIDNLLFITKNPEGGENAIRLLKSFFKNQILLLLMF
jgi:hypothetical protein